MAYTLKIWLIKFSRSTIFFQVATRSRKLCELFFKILKVYRADIVLYFSFFQSSHTGRGLIIKRAEERFYGRITHESSVVLRWSPWKLMTHIHYSNYFSTEDYPTPSQGTRLKRSQSRKNSTWNNAITPLNRFGK